MEDEKRKVEWENGRYWEIDKFWESNQHLRLDNKQDEITMARTMGKTNEHLQKMCSKQIKIISSAIFSQNPVPAIYQYH